MTGTLATIDLFGVALPRAWLAVGMSLVGALLVVLARYWLGRWPDLWRFRRRVLPLLGRLADGGYDEELDVVDERVGVDPEGVAEALPEKTGVPLQAREFVGTIDASPSEVRAELREMPRVYRTTLRASSSRCATANASTRSARTRCGPRASSASGSTTFA